MAKKQRIKISTVSRNEVATAFARAGAKNKEDFAKVLAGRFPELYSALPPKREPGDSEHYRMAIFGAVALALEAATHGN